MNDKLQIEIDGRSLEARKGTMIIDVADEAGIYIPRFCYHKKLSIAANCRMCLVEVEKAPKPMPACATPVMDGMKVFTGSPRAIAAQRATMEFLLINHPLDCPICDQGGECELQDLAMGYGSGVSRFTERKRAVKDKDIGPLVATEMTRCIHCTRCVRFGEEIAGLRELGATGRGENMEIGTYVEHAMVSEISGNVIDLCPVGALTAKPSRYQARSWEMVQHPGVSPHDCVGSNTYQHTIRNKVVRVVPRDNEAVNESWLSDRDRFAYLGLNAEDRALKPAVGRGAERREVEWEDALNAAAEGLTKALRQHGPEAVGVLISPTATLEEMYLLQKLARGLGIQSIDHRLRQADFDDQADAPLFPWLGQDLADLENLEAAFLIGSNIRMEQPLAAHRIRKAALQGARVSFLNARRYDFRFPITHQFVERSDGFVPRLAAVAAALSDLTGTALPKSFHGVGDIAYGDPEKRLAGQLAEAERGTVILGNQAINHPDLSRLRLLAGWIAKTSGCTFGYLSEGGNGAGAWLAGALPHREVAGREIETPGAGAGEMIEESRKAYILLGVEPEYDLRDPTAAVDAINGAEFVLSLSAFTDGVSGESADVLLPVGASAETSGTYVNAEGRWQTVPGAVTPPGAGRPAWRVLRVLGNLLSLEGFEYTSPAQIVDEVFEACRELDPNNVIRLGRRIRVGEASKPEGLQRAGDVPIYRQDPLTRRSDALQQTPLAEESVVRVNPRTAEELGVGESELVTVRQGEATASFSVRFDEGVPVKCVWLPAAAPGSEVLGAPQGTVVLEPAAQTSVA